MPSAELMSPPGLFAVAGHEITTKISERDLSRTKGEILASDCGTGGARSKSAAGSESKRAEGKLVKSNLSESGSCPVQAPQGAQAVGGPGGWGFSGLNGDAGMRQRQGQGTPRERERGDSRKEPEVEGSRAKECSSAWSCKRAVTARFDRWGRRASGRVGGRNVGGGGCKKPKGGSGRRKGEEGGSGWGRRAVGEWAARRSVCGLRLDGFGQRARACAMARAPAPQLLGADAGDRHGRRRARGQGLRRCSAQEASGFWRRAIGAGNLPRGMLRCCRQDAEDKT